MKRTLLRTAVLALTACLFAAAPVRAGNIKWDYNWTPITPPIDGSGKYVLYSTNKQSSIQLSDDPLVKAENNTDVVATNIITASNTDPHNQDTFSNALYALKLTITDKQSGLTGSLTFTGHLDGTLSAKSALITNTFTGLQMQSIQVGGHLYTVTLDSYTHPGPPNAGNKGSIAGSVTVTDAPNHNAPEPATLVLAFVGMSGCGLAAWRRRAGRSA
jgi:hypothetical protein